MQTTVTNTVTGNDIVMVNVNVMFTQQEWNELQAIGQDIDETRVRAIKAAVEHFLLWS